MKRKKQIEESKELISQGLVTLLENDDFSKISISQITAEAKVSRNTFYRNFNSKEEILIYTYKRFYKEALKKLEKKGPASIEDFLIWRFRLFKNNPIIKSLRKNAENTYPIFMQFFSDYPIPFDSHITKNDPYLKAYHSAGIYYITMLWLRNGAKESPKEMAARILKIIKS